MPMRRIRWMMSALAVLSSGSCATGMTGEPFDGLAWLTRGHFAGHSSSPWEVGGGATIGALVPIGPTGLMAGPVGSFSYLKWDGGGGHDNLFELAAQVRKSVGSGERPPWVSGELGFAHMKSAGDGGEFGDFSESDSGWSAWVHAGVPLTPMVGVFAGGGVTGLWGGHGKNVRIGIEINPPF